MTCVPREIVKAAVWTSNQGLGSSYFFIIYYNYNSVTHGSPLHSSFLCPGALGGIKTDINTRSSFNTQRGTLMRGRGVRLEEDKCWLCPLHSSELTGLRMLSVMVIGL
jgi:hypothetical protein